MRGGRFSCAELGTRFGQDGFSDNAGDACRVRRLADEVRRLPSLDPWQPFVSEDLGDPVTTVLQGVVRAFRKRLLRAPKGIDLDWVLARKFSP